MRNKVIELMHRLWDDSSDMEKVIEGATDKQLMSICMYLEGQLRRERKINLDNEIRKMKNEGLHLIKQPEHAHWQEEKDFVRWLKEK